MFNHGAIAIRNAEIADVGSESQMSRFQPARVMDAGGGLVHPGLMDLHYHVSYHLVGKLVAEVDLSGDDPGPWAAQQYTAMINTLGDEEEYASAMLCGLDMLTSGVTLVMDPGSTFEPDTLAQASQALGFRVSLADPWIMDTKGTADHRCKTGQHRARSSTGRARRSAVAQSGPEFPGERTHFCLRYGQRLR